MLQHLIIQFPPYDLLSGRLREVKNKRNFQTFSSRSGRGRLREVVAYKRFQIQWFDWETFGILENWSLRRGGRLREVVATGGSTVFTSNVKNKAQVRRTSNSNWWSDNFKQCIIGIMD